MIWDTKLWLLAHLPYLGIWMILFRTPFARHAAWYFSRDGRRAGQDVWTQEEFAGHLTVRGGSGPFLAELWSCNGCQSFHVGWMTGLGFWFQSPYPLPALPVVILMCLPSALVGVRILSKI